MTKVLFIIAPENFREEELFTPMTILRRAGIKCLVASQREFLKNKIAKGVSGKNVIFDLDIKEVQEADFEAIVLVGGRGALIYEGDRFLNGLIAKFILQDKLIAAICIAPRILAAGGFLQGKNATAWNGDGQQALLIKEKGGQFVDQAVVVSGKIITANGPQSAELFGEKILDKLNEGRSEN